MDSQSQQARAGAKPRQVREFRRDAQRGDTPAYLQDRNEAIVATLYDIGLRVGELVALDTEFCPGRHTERFPDRPLAELHRGFSGSPLSGSSTGLVVWR